MKAFEKNGNEYLADMDEIEPECIAIRIKGKILYAYPFDKDVADTGAKVITRDGRVVKKVRVTTDNNAVTGVLGEEVLTWDRAGRINGAYINDERDLYIPERYFMRRWKDFMKLSNSEWAATYQLRHDSVKIPE